MAVKTIKWFIERLSGFGKVGGGVENVSLSQKKYSLAPLNVCRSLNIDWEIFIENANGN